MTVLCIILSLLATIIWSVRPVESVERDNGGRDQDLSQDRLTHRNGKLKTRSGLDSGVWCSGNNLVRGEAEGL